ncbi:MAG: VanZ family protein [Clostridiales bacterium]|jgi:VanZ family protein|nr:VanZ family protein [Eubacteriales bacterium]MDH7566498.1 VanZ family protein [Clostridiales bacterium]
MREKTHKSFHAKIAAWTAFVLYLALIFAFSSQSGPQSNRISRGIVKEVGEYVQLPPTVIKGSFLGELDYNFILRKSAHFLEYFLLAVLAYRILLFYHIPLWKSRWMTFFFCMIFAFLDELHQRMVAGRTPSFRDVTIDAAGILFALFVVKQRMRRGVTG